MSESPEVLLQRATDYHKAGRYAEAESLYRSVLSANAGQLDATFLLGVLAAQTDREDMAVELLTDVANRDPLNFEAAKWLSGVLSFLNQFGEAEPYALRAVRLRPQNYDAILKLATVQFGLRKYVLAADTFKRAITLARGRLDAYYGLATTFLKQGEPYLARQVLRDAVKVEPSPEALLKLGEVCLACEQPAEAIKCAEDVLTRSPNEVAALTLLVRAHRNAQNEELEDSALTRLLEQSPDDQLGHTLYGRRLQSLGHFAEAEIEFARSIELNPDQGVAYYGITAGRRILEKDRSLVEQMEKVSVEGTMNQDERAHLHFALGKAFDNLGDYGKAMGNFESGNRLMRDLRMGTRRFDRDEASARIDRIIQIFTKEFIEHEQGRIAQKHSPVPVFIAGIMRSGTTLAEQILSCHPDVGGGGEQGFWRRVDEECIDYTKGAVHTKKIKARSAEYLEVLSRLAPGCPYVTDKNPANRMVYGLLQIAFPDSRIIHMRRNPVDVAISIFTTLIRTGAPFVGDREDIVFALREHDRLSEHWKTVLPREGFLEVEYESLVQDRETTTRAMVEFCGLPWSDACLRPEENLRTVVTPSFWQVRQPVYTGSLARWKRYEPWLGPFAELIPQS